MDSLWQDLRYALRGLRNQPGFAALAVLTLALGIGATTTMYSVIYNVLFDPFPYVDADRVVAFQIRPTERANQTGRSYFQTSEWLDYKEKNHVFEECIATGPEDVLMTTTEGTLQFTGALVSENMFTFLGVPPLYGRGLAPSDAQPGAPPVFVMAHKMWTKHYNFDPSVVGRTFTLNGIPVTCVGVMPPRFTKMAADLYRPIVLDRANPEIKDQYFMFQARPKPGVTLQQIEADITVLAKQLATVYPRNYPEGGKFIVKAVTWVDNVIGPFRRTLTTLGAAVALLLLIACTNVANLLLARATTREKEMALRASLGATRGRLVRQLLIESLVLALLGALVGSGFAWLGVKLLVANIPDGAIPREAVIHLNGPVLAFSLGVAILTALIFGLVPALQAARKDLVEPLKDSGKGASGGFRRGKLRSALVIVEVALSLMLLAGAGLLIRSFVKLTAVDLGFDPNRLLVSRVPLPRGQYKSADEKQRYFTQLVERVQALPGVKAAATATSWPAFGGPRLEVDIPGQTHTERWEAQMSLCSEGYFSALGLRTMRGRLFTDSDVIAARKVAVVNQEFVKRFLAQREPVGQLVRFKRLIPPSPAPSGSQPAQAGAAGNVSPTPDDPAFEIIGVVGDTKNRGPQAETVPEAFVPHSVTGSFERGLLLHAAGNPAALINSVRREIWAQDRAVAVTDINSLSTFLRDYTYASPRFSVLVLGVFAAVGLVLVALGIYSVVAYTVSRQTHELGIRMALGASRSDVMRLVLRMGLTLVIIGAVAGLVTSLILARVLTLTNQLWQVPPNDPLTLAAVFVVITIIGFLACYIPARRATRVDPIVALRTE
jgi:putative ABC transport system permease protein